MRQFKVSLALCALSWLACSPPPTGPCGGQTCAANERCDTDALRCVPGGTGDSGVLRLTLTPPAGVVTSATFEVRGQLESDDPNTRVEWVNGTVPAMPITVGAGGAFSFTALAPLSDTTTVDVSVTATNSRNEGTFAALQVPVDRVGPVINLAMVPARAVNALLLSGWLRQRQHASLRQRAHASRCARRLQLRADVSLDR